jgi:hypothetical protein
MTKYEFFLGSKPGTQGGNTKVIIEADNVFKARDMAEAQYGSKYRILSHTLA